MARQLLLRFVTLALVAVLGACSTDGPGTPTTTTMPVSTAEAVPAKEGEVPTTSVSATVRQPTAWAESTEETPSAPPAAPVPAATEATILTGSAPAAPATPAPTPEPTPPATAEPTPETVHVDRSSMTREEAPDVPEAELAALIESNNAFAFDLYRAIPDSEGNLFFSPHSISTSLAMAYSGARGDTERQMAESLHFNLPQDRLHPAFNSLGLLLAQTPEGADNEGFRLSVANSVWAQRGYGFLPEYLDTLALNYGDQVRPVDFRRDPEGARLQINDWVSDETKERVTNLIPEVAINDLTRMVLANAIYFQAAWSNTFDERATRDRTFHLLNGSERPVPMMRQQANFLYANGDGYQAVELPYRGGEVAITILLPDSGTFRQFEESLSGDLAEKVLKGLEGALVRLTVPKFDIESAIGLSGTLKAMGMPDAFDDRAADFSGMDGRVCRARGDICLLISDVLHKAFVSVDEDGTEAAAATAVIVGVTRAVETQEPVELVVDRPFLFVIRHLGTGAILFLGRVVDP